MLEQRQLVCELDKQQLGRAHAKLGGNLHERPLGEPPRIDRVADKRKRDAFALVRDGDLERAAVNVSAKQPFPLRLDPLS